MRVYLSHEVCVYVYGGGAHVAKSAASFLVFSLSQIQIDQPAEPSHSLRQPPTPLLEKVYFYIFARTPLNQT
jgi:hypothetical protein